MLYLFKEKQKHNHKYVAAGGTAAELVRFGHIESTTEMQEGDRINGNFHSIWEIQEVADPIADRIETDLSQLYRFVLTRMKNGKGFGDINKLINRGAKIVEIFNIAHSNIIHKLS